MDKRTIINTVAILAVIALTVTVIINPTASISVGGNSLFLGPALAIFSMLFILGVMTAAMLRGEE